MFQRSPVYQIGAPDMYFTYLRGIVSQSLYELILLQYIILSSYYDLCLAHPFTSLPLTRQPVAIAFSMLPADMENLCSFLFFFLSLQLFFYSHAIDETFGKWRMDMWNKFRVSISLELDKILVNIKNIDNSGSAK